MDKDVDVNFMLVPNAVSIYEAKLPYNVKSTQRETMDFVKDNLSDKIRFVDVDRKSTRLNSSHSH